MSFTNEDDISQTLPSLESCSTRLRADGYA